MSKKGKSVKNLAIGSAIAAIAGYIAGLLTAPKAGKESRAEIADVAQKSWSETEKEVKKLSSDLSDVIKEANAKKSKAGSKAHNELKGALEKAQDNKEKLREILSAIHEGDAEDHDLKRAINDASKALEHLKDYIDK